MLAAGLIFGVTVAVANWSHGPSGKVTATQGETAPEVRAKAAVEKALRVHMSLAIPPNVAGMNLSGPSEVDLQQQVSDGQAAANDVFGPDLAKKELVAVDTSVAMQRGGNFKALAAGSNDFEIHSLQFDAFFTTAVVKGTVEVWSRMSLKNPDGSWHDAEPHNKINFTMTLTNDNKWLVQTFDWSFVPGTGP